MPANSLGSSRLITSNVSAITKATFFSWLFLNSTAGSANTPVCLSPDSDSDNDGWGWENNSSCIVAGSETETTISSQSGNICQFLASDEDGDGWGWENNASCRVGAETSTDAPVTPVSNFVPVTDNSGRLVCQSADADPDGDGYGWENNASCIVSGGVAEQALSLIHI